MLNGGARQEAFDLTDRVDFFDPFGGFLQLQPPPLIFTVDGLTITLPDGSTQSSLRELRDYFVQLERDLGDPGLVLLVVDLLTTQDPNRLETNNVQVLIQVEDVPTVTENQRLIEIHDPWNQVRDFENVISPAGEPGIRINRNTEIVFADGSFAEEEDLNFGVRIRVTGTEQIFPDGFGGERTASRIEIIGGEPFFVDALVEAVDETNRTITLQADPPESIDQRAYIGDARGRRIQLNALANTLAGGDNLEVLVRFNPYSDGIVRLEVVDPNVRRNFRPEDIIFPCKRSFR